jgi:hypothetical protein
MDVIVVRLQLWGIDRHFLAFFHDAKDQEFDRRGIPRFVDLAWPFMQHVSGFDGNRRLPLYCFDF